MRVNSLAALQKNWKKKKMKESEKGKKCQKEKRLTPLPILLDLHLFLSEFRERFVAELNHLSFTLTKKKMKEKERRKKATEDEWDRTNWTQSLEWRTLTVELLTSEQEDKTNILLYCERLNSGRVESQDERFILLRRKEREEKLMNLNLYYRASSISRRVTLIFFV